MLQNLLSVPFTCGIRGWVGPRAFLRWMLSGYKAEYSTC